MLIDLPWTLKGLGNEDLCLDWATGEHYTAVITSEAAAIILSLPPSHFSLYICCSFFVDYSNWINILSIVWE